MEKSKRDKVIVGHFLTRERRWRKKTCEQEKTIGYPTDQTRVMLSRDGMGRGNVHELLEPEYGPFLVFVCGNQLGTGVLSFFDSRDGKKDGK